MVAGDAVGYGSTINQTGNNTITFGDAGDNSYLNSGSSWLVRLVWRVVVKLTVHL